MNNEDIKTKTDFESQNNDNDKKSTSNKFLVLGVLLTLIMVVIIAFYVNHSQKEYIDGNILKLPSTSGVESEYQGVGNPWKNASISGQLVFRSLFSTDSTLTEINPDLCSEYEILNDGLTYVITLKDNLRWSDSTPITVDDVIFSIEAFMECSGVNPSISAAFNKISGVNDYVSGESSNISGLIGDGNKLTIELEQKYNNFLPMLTQFVPLPKHILKDEDLSTLTSNHSFFINENPVVSGMYFSAGLNEDKNLVLEKNPYYEEEQPKIDQVILYWDHANMDVDFYHTTDITQIVNYRSKRGFEEYLVDVYFYRYFVFNITDDNGNVNEAMQDVRVRQAINHAIDIKTLLKEIYYDAGTMIYGGSDDVANVELYEYNPQKARELLEEANYDFDRTFKILYYYKDATSYIFLERVANYLQDVGLKVELVLSETNDDIYIERDYDMFLKGLASFNTEDWYNEFLSTYATMSQLLGTKGEFDGLVDELNSVIEHDDYVKVLEELVELEQSLLYKMPLFTLNQAVYINSNRLKVPDDMLFGNTRYSNDLRVDEWEIMKE